MFDDILGPEMFPYAAAAGVLLGLVVIELAATVAGAGPLSALGHSLGAHAHGGSAVPGHAPSAGRPGLSVLGWLNAGRAPFAVVPLALLAGFALAGSLIVMLCRDVGAACPTWASMPIAAAAAVIATRRATRLVGRLMPQDETYAVGPDALLGHVAVVTVGPVRLGHRGRCKTRDRYGNWHFPLIEVLDDIARFMPGESVMLVAYRSGAFTVAAPDPRLLTKPPAGDAGP